MISVVPAVLGVLLVLLFHSFNLLFLKPILIRAKLQRQGIIGLSPYVFLGNIPELRGIQLKNHPTEKDKDKDTHISHGWPSTLFPHIEKWRKQYVVITRL